MNKLPDHQGRKTQGDCHVNGARLPHTGFPSLTVFACQLGNTGNIDSSKEN